MSDAPSSNNHMTKTPSSFISDYVKVAKSLTSFQLFIYNVDFQLQDSNLSIHLSTPTAPSTSTGLKSPTFEAAESSQNPGMHQRGHHKGPRERWIESTSTQLPKVLWGHQTAASSGWVFFPICWEAGSST